MYVPHGAVPDRRGFAPAIVAWELARRLKTVAPCVVSAREDHDAFSEMVQGIPVHRIQEGRLYRRLFRKATRLDPWPLHRRAPLSLADRYVAVTRYMRDRLIELGFPAGRIEVIHNGVDT